MQLRGIEFGKAFNASGARNFTGKGYWFHHIFRYCGLSYKGSTLITKTSTVFRNEGNMPLKEDGETPREWSPRCIYPNFRKRIVLNAVALSGPGLEAILEKGKLQQLSSPTVVSLMAISSTKEERLEEDREFARILREYKGAFRAPIAIQKNWSCPNVGLHLEELMEETEESLNILGEIETPIIGKFNAELPPSTAVHIAMHPQLDAICMSNTIPFGRLSERIDWEGLFGSNPTSPLIKRGFKQPGGLSGKPLLPIVRDWIVEASERGISVPIVACGGILSPGDVDTMKKAGASAIEVGSASILAPWNVQRIIRRANQIF